MFTCNNEANQIMKNMWAGTVNNLQEKSTLVERGGDTWFHSLLRK